MRMMLMVMATIVLGGAARAAEVLPLFPAQLAGAAIQKPAQAYDAKTIYDYMDGAADHYLRFDFRQLYAADYKLGEQLVVVEAYDMGTPAEAYGVFSTDQEGSAVAAGQGARLQAGMLRAWTDRFFLKVAGREDTPAFRDFATEMVKRFAEALGTGGARPELISILPEKELHPTRIGYFHSVEDLNYAYYVSTENVLGLGKGRTDVVIADAQVGGKPLKVAVVHYAKAEDRAQAISKFTKIIFSKKAARDKDGTWVEAMRKDQFTGLRPFAGPAKEPMLALCFEAKTAAQCRAALTAITGSRK